MTSGGRAWIEGVALWAPRLPDWPRAREILCGRETAPEKSTSRPVPTLLPPAERRRAPDSVALALEVASRACGQSGCDPKTLASVFASTQGDLAISDYMCDILAKSPELTSPTKFHNSVHNAAAGYWTIGTGCVKPYTALSAYRHTFGVGLLETAVQVSGDDEPVLYVAYDVEARGPLAAIAKSEGLLGVALVLAPAPSARSVAAITWGVRAAAEQVHTTPARPANAALIAGNALAGCLSFFEALAAADRARVNQSLGPRLALELQIEPSGEHA